MPLPTFKAGDLKDRVMLQSDKTDRSYTGSETTVENWDNEKELWAQVRPLSVREQNEALRTVGTVSHQVTVRSLGISVTTRKRFKFGARYLNVVGAYDYDEAGVFTRVFCMEKQ